MYRRASQGNNRSGSVAPTAGAVENTMIFYICPRPVFLVSVDDGQRSNIFPMDLVGPIAPDRFTLALRNSSPSVETIKTARKLALASVPAADYQIAHQLGTHHKKPKIDWEGQPFRVSRSKEFSLPTMSTALRVREIEILDFQSAGSHTLFVGRIVSDERLENGPQLFHTCGVYQHLRTRYKRPFQAVFKGSAPGDP